MNRLDRLLIERHILEVQKPARYIGGELNAIIKEKADFHMAISYPDLYDVGMSNNGIRILYDIANKREGVACERVFAVADDFEALLRKENIPLYTLESFIPLCELDLLAFNLSHELLYTNVLQVLDLGQVPLLSSERDDSHPLVIAGGEAVSNPFPMSDFIDAFFVGDGEHGIGDIIEVIESSKKENLKRGDILKRLGEIEGVLIPSEYSISYNGIDTESIEGKTVKKRVYRDCELIDPLKPIVPNMRITQERAVLEIARGCSNLCKFCHAGYYDLPYRKYDQEMISDRVFEIISNTGYNELTLSSLSISDYRSLTGLLNRIIPGLTEQGVSISLPSLKVDKRTVPIIEIISDVRKTSLTFAVESASEEIRGLANKKVAEEDLLDILRSVFNRGWRKVKLYFMIGLPGCEEFDEADAIIGLLKKVLKVAGKGKDINVTISPFVPKSHTPFQWARQMDMEYLDSTILRIKQ